LNYSDFSFWWVLILYSIPFFTVRYFGRKSGFWQDNFDGIGLAIMSLLLFSNTNKTSFVVFISEVILNYLMVAWMLRRQGWQAKMIATGIIIFDILVLAYFKYIVFFVEDFIGLLINIPDNWQNSLPFPAKNRIPPGISFYTFQMVSFVVDSFNTRKKKPIGFIDYINFVSFFPQIVAGPIERKIDLFPQIESFRFKFTLDNWQLGLRWLSLGFFFKFVLGDNLFPFIELDNATNPWVIWFQAFLFTLRIYFDFAGYSFIAVGLAWFLGVRLTINFLAPYTSQSINEFWQRWHITLSTWFRDYVFIPLMGRNKQYAPFYLFITFTLSGFWHGAAWNFILWGAYHGALLLILRYVGRPFHRFLGQYIKRPQFVSWALTFASVTLGCLFFMDTNIQRLGAKIATILNPLNYSLGNLGALFSSYSLNETTALGLLVLLSIGVLFLEHLAVWKQKSEYEFLLSPKMSLILLGLTVLLAANTPSQFIYFEF
jgi:D-alanyl-lipoteichoic acid acyltransferase DltB (MBOAT superfamily)